MADELPLYPGGQVSLGTGNAKHVESCSLKFANGASLAHTLAASPAGVTMGNRDCSGTMVFLVPDTGPEFDVMTAVAKGTKKQFRYKAATATWGVTGVFNDCAIDFPGRGAAKITASWVGKYSDSPTT